MYMCKDIASRPPTVVTTWCIDGKFKPSGEMKTRRINVRTRPVVGSQSMEYAQVVCLGFLVILVLELQGTICDIHVLTITTEGLEMLPTPKMVSSR